MSTYMTAKQVEAKLQETRREREFTGKVEKEAVKVIVETAKRNGNFGIKHWYVLIQFMYISQYGRESCMFRQRLLLVKTIIAISGKSRRCCIFQVEN